jgi:hypothetical protein
MAQRLEVSALLHAISGPLEVYFQPPPSTQMVYPCIRYELDDEITEFADNIPYQVHERYKVTVIDRDPDSAIPGKVRQLPKTTFDRVYKADGLYHFVYNLFP